MFTVPPNECRTVLDYTRSPFEFPSKYYKSYQENGTKYVKSLRQLPEILLEQLNQCAGEIFISGIPSAVVPRQIAEIASILGEIYILRFKVTFSGGSRGFAYLQYLNPNLLQVALLHLQQLFKNYGLPTIRVYASRNSSTLLLKRVYRMSPPMVYNTLLNLVPFRKLVGHELSPNYFVYQIVFQTNEDAVHARRVLIRSSNLFGRNALCLWDLEEEEKNTFHSHGDFGDRERGQRFYQQQQPQLCCYPMKNEQHCQYNGRQSNL